MFSPIFSSVNWHKKTRLLILRMFWALWTLSFENAYKLQTSKKSLTPWFLIVNWQDSPLFSVVQTWWSGMFWTLWTYLIYITLEKCIYKLPLKKSLTPLFSIVNWQDFTSIFSCTNTMIQNVLNFVNAIWVKFCHARFLNALKGMLATQEWPSTAMLRHFIKPIVANVCATQAHLFAQNPLKVIFPLSLAHHNILKGQVRNL